MILKNESSNPPWTSHLLHPAAIMSIYGEPPSVKHIRIHGIQLNSEASLIELRFDLNSYPLVPPKKWREQKFNTVQIILSLIETVKFEVKGWVPNVIADMDIEELDKLKRILIVADSFSLSAESQFLDIRKISAYQNCHGLGEKA